MCSTTYSISARLFSLNILRQCVCSWAQGSVGWKRNPGEYEGLLLHTSLHHLARDVGNVKQLLRDCDVC